MDGMNGNFPSTTPETLAVTGGGLMGATLAYRYAQEHPNAAITLLEKLPETVFTTPDSERSDGYALSSSQAGDLTTRSLRATLQEKNNLDLAIATRDLYLDLQTKSNEKLFVGSAAVNVIDTTDQDAMDELAMQQARFDRYGMKYHVYTDKTQLLADHPEYHTLFAHAEYPENYVILHEDGFDPERNPNGVSGIVNPAAVLRALHAELKQLPNVSIHYDTALADINVTKQGKASLLASDGTALETDRAVLSVGPWLQHFESKLEGLPKVKPNRVTYANIPVPGQTTLPPFIKGLGVTTLAASMEPDANGIYAIKKLMPEKETIRIATDGLATRPITPSEIDEAVADLESAHGITLNAADRAAVTGSSGIVASSHGKRAVIDYVGTAGTSKDHSPILVHGLDNYTMATMVGGAAYVASAKLDGKDEPYKGSYANYAANNPLQYAEKAKVPATAQTEALYTPSQELSK